MMGFGGSQDLGLAGAGPLPGPLMCSILGGAQGDIPLCLGDVCAHSWARTRLWALASAPASKSGEPRELS